MIYLIFYYYKFIKYTSKIHNFLEFPVILAGIQKI